MWCIPLTLVPITLSFKICSKALNNNVLYIHFPSVSQNFQTTVHSCSSFLKHFLFPSIIFSNVDTRMGHRICSFLYAAIILFPCSLHMFILILLKDPKVRLNFREAHCQLVICHDPKLPLRVTVFQEFVHHHVFVTYRLHFLACS